MGYGVLFLVWIKLVEQQKASQQQLVRQSTRGAHEPARRDERDTRNVSYARASTRIAHLHTTRCT
jgi:hypothetical protein